MDKLKEKIFSSNKNTFLFIGASVFLFLLTYQLILLFNGTYYHSNSDDVAQYSSILNQYFEYVKNGKFAMFNFSNNLGSSVMGDVYYVPIDIFSILAFLLSFIMNGTIAFSCVELVKILLGVMVFAYFLQRHKFNNKIVLLLSFMYFCYGGSLTYSVYPTYLSMYFYLPLSLLMIDFYKDGKKWLMPLYSFILVLYNFYNAYTLFVFMVVVYLITCIRDEYKSFKDLCLKIIAFGLHIVLGVVMALFIFLPSFLYIIKFSNRTGGYFQVLFDFSVYIRMITKLFIMESGTASLHSGLNGYIQDHFGIYIGIFGLFILSLLFCMKDRTSKIYKRSLIVVACLMCIPVVSMIVSGIGTAYTRWFSFINVLLIYLVGYILENINLEKIDKKKKMIAYGTVILLYVFILTYHIITGLTTVGRGAIHSTYCTLLLLIALVFTCLYVVFYLSKQTKLMGVVVLGELVAALVFNFYTPLTEEDRLPVISQMESVNDVLKKLDIEKDSIDRTYVEGMMVNGSRLSSKLTNEGTFHSFMPKYIYSHLELINDYVDFWNISNLDVFSPYYSRIMDYKYVVLDNDDSYNLDYLSKYYENDEFSVYLNENYESFYVYENYYNEKEVLALNSSNDLLALERKLFDGVILDEGQYNLNELAFDYSGSKTVKKLVYNPLTLINNEKDFSEYFIDENLTIYISSENDFDGINSISLVSEENETYACKIIDENYECHMNGKLKKLVVDGEANGLEYSIFIEDEDENKYSVFLINELLEEEYIEYTAFSTDLYIKYENGGVQECHNGYCKLVNNKISYMYFENATSNKKRPSLGYLNYVNDDLSWYNSNYKDEYASNKSLSYDGKYLNVSYDRISSSDSDQVVVLPVTYSEEWQIKDNKDGYKIVKANGGYLGIIVDNNIEEIDVSLTFKPMGLKVGVVGSVCGFVIYGAYIVFVYFGNRKKEDNKDE